MKYILVLFIFPFLSLSECGKKNDSLPVCVQKILDNQNKEILPDSPVQIDEYKYNGKTVFLFTAPCCDQYNVLYGGDCGMICAPSGGITGKGDGKCENFSKNAEFVKLIWKKPAK